jgi:CHASE2 domain-containing sensor protein
MTAPEGQTEGWVGRAVARARRPKKEHMEALRLHVPYWFVVAVLFGFATLQIWLNPFGFSDLVQRYTQDISDLLITGPYLYPQTGHEKVSVALVDDDTLKNLDMPWPWTYGAQARALDALLAYKPRAVVVDMLFVDSRKDPTLKELTDEIGRYKRAGVPLYFSASPSAAPGTPPVRQEILDTGVKLVDPTIQLNQGIARQYPIAATCPNPKQAGPCLSDAFTVYRDLCSPPLRAKDGDICPSDLPPLPDGMMELVWGTRADATNAKWMHLRDADGNLYACDGNQQVGWMRRIFLAFFDPAAVRSRCPYQSVIPVQSLLMGAEDADVARLASNRIVYYGASLEGVEDKSFTPVNGLIASVFVHAMAMDNLVTFKGHPQQNVAVIAGVTLDANAAQIAAVIPVVLVLGWMHMCRVRRRRIRKDHPVIDAVAQYFIDLCLEKAWHYVAFGLALGAGLLLTLACGLSVANWIEVVFVSVELAAMLLVGVPDSIWGYLHHVAGGMPQMNQAEEHA